MPCASTSLNKGVSDDGGYDVLTVMTSFKRGCVGRIGSLAGCMLGRKLDLERAVNRSVESNLWENSTEDEENNSFLQKTPPPNSRENGILTSKQ